MLRKLSADQALPHEINSFKDLLRAETHLRVVTLNGDAMTYNAADEFHLDNKGKWKVLNRFRLPPPPSVNLNFWKINIAKEKGYFKGSWSTIQYQYMAAYKNIADEYERYFNSQKELYAQLALITIDTWSEKIFTDVEEIIKKIQECENNFKLKLADFKEKEKEIEETWKQALGIENFEFKEWKEEDDLSLKKLIVDHESHAFNKFKDTKLPKNNLSDQIHRFRVGYHASVFAAHAEQKAELNFLALQGLDKETTEIYEQELDAIGWKKAGKSVGIMGQLCGFYNGNNLTFEQHDIGGDTGLSAGYAIYYFKNKKNNEEIIYVNFHSTCQNQSIFEMIKAKLGDKAAVILGSCDQSFVNPRELNGHTIPGQVGLSIIPSRDRELSSFIYQYVAMIFENVPSIGWRIPTQTAMKTTEDSSLKLIIAPNFTSNEIKKSTKSYSPVSQPEWNHLKANTILYPKLMKCKLEYETEKAVSVLGRATYNAIFKALVNHEITDDQIPLFHDYLSNLFLNHNHDDKWQRLLENIAIAGINKYLARGKSHLNFLQAAVSEEGVNRAHCYLNALKPEKLSFKKDVILYAMLIAKDGKTLQSDVILVDVIKEELNERLVKYCLVAACKDVTRSKQYEKKLRELVDKIASAAGSVSADNQNFPKHLLDKINDFRRILCSSSKLIRNIVCELKKIKTEANGKESDLLKKIKSIAKDKENKNRFSEIQAICESAVQSNGTLFGLFSPLAGLDDNAKLILRAIAGFDANQAVNPKADSLESIMKIQKQREQPGIAQSSATEIYAEALQHI